MGIPHLRIPFRVNAGAAQTVEQDSLEEIAQCVQVLVSTHPGDRIELLDYGVPDPVFRNELSGSTTALVDQVKKWEPRAVTAFADYLDDSDELVRHLQVQVSARNVQPAPPTPQVAVVSVPSTVPDPVVLHGYAGGYEGGY